MQTSLKRLAIRGKMDTTTIQMLFKLNGNTLYCRGRPYHAAMIGNICEKDNKYYCDICWVERAPPWKWQFNPKTFEIMEAMDETKIRL
jgi:hypothetical protein